MKVSAYAATVSKHHSPHNEFPEKAFFLLKINCINVQVSSQKLKSIAVPALMDPDPCSRLNKMKLFLQLWA